MKFLIISLWLILFLTTPIVLILIAGNAYGSTAAHKIVGKLIISFFIYIIVTIFSFIYSVAFIIGLGEIRHEPMTFVEEAFALFVVYLYGGAIYLLCSFINGAFYKPSQLTLFRSKKPTSIFKPE